MKVFRYSKRSIGLGLAVAAVMAQAQSAHAILTFGLIDDSGCEVYSQGKSAFCSAAGNLACAPAVLENNLDRVQRVLTDIANRPEFRPAQRFQQMVKDYVSAKTPAEKIGILKKSAGIESDEDLIAFMGARSIEKKHVEALNSSLSLDSTQSTTILSEIAGALRGDLVDHKDSEISAHPSKEGAAGPVSSQSGGATGSSGSAQ
jgi:hypothetical protein